VVPLGSATLLEDILSLLEMRASLANEDSLRKAFVKYIRDVVEAYTPSIPTPTEQQHWAKTIFGPEPWGTYGLFVATLLKHNFQRVNGRKHPNSIEYDAIDHAGCPCDYAVITLNYDLVLESMADDLNKRFRTKLYFRRGFTKSPDEGSFAACLAKLHGSIDTNDIIAPTWNKTLATGSILKAWQLAHWLLETANHIRVIGYSLAGGDNYIRYLFRAAVIGNPHLKSFDVMCLDVDGGVRKRYEEFICFPNFRFKSLSIATYLEDHLKSYGDWPEKVTCDTLEQAHRRLFG
jgi:hypothetical protein